MPMNVPVEVPVRDAEMVRRQKNVIAILQKKETGYDDSDSHSRSAQNIARGEDIRHARLHKPSRDACAAVDGIKPRHAGAGALVVEVHGNDFWETRLLVLKKPEKSSFFGTISILSVINGTLPAPESERKLP